MKPALNDVTICAIDCINPELAIRAIQKSLLECDFKKAIFFSDEKTNIPNIKSIQINQLKSKDEYSKFILKELYQHIETSHVLVVQWDGYVIDGKQWNNNFLKYDYIGAKWHWHNDGMNIGNGGFSIRSKELLKTLSTDAFPFMPKINEDDQICRFYRKKLERDYSIKFPSEKLADQFSYERSVPDHSTFGFHGLFNLWRYLDDAEIIKVAGQFHPNVYHSPEFFELTIQYFIMRKFKPLNSLYTHIKSHCSQNEIHEKLFSITNDSEFAKWFIANHEMTSAP
jgi:hypothetical protein